MVRRSYRLALVLLALWAVAAVYLFTVRGGDRPRRASAVVVLSGAKQRLPIGLRLVREGYAPLLVVSRSDRPKPLENRVCAGNEGVAAICPRAVPYSTRGEARMIARLARQRGWSRVVVVTSRFHVFRARRMIERCYHGPLSVVAAPNPRWTVLAENFFAESVKLVYHELARGC